MDVVTGSDGGAVTETDLGTASREGTDPGKAEPVEMAMGVVMGMVTDTDLGPVIDQGKDGVAETHIRNC